MPRFLLPLAMFALAAAHALPAGEKPFAFPDTPAGRSAAAYFAAFNAGESRMKDYLMEHLARSGMERVPMEERLARYRAFRDDAVTLRPLELVEAGPDRVRLVAEARDGRRLEFDFGFESAEPHRLLGIRIEVLDESEPGEPPGPPLTQAELLAEMEQALEKAALAGTFSGVVLLARGDEVVFHRARGLASLEYQAPNLPSTRFNLGSINKLFTRVAVTQLAERGQLCLDDKLGKFLPDYPNLEAAQKVTVRHLLEMSSGIGDFFGPAYEATPKNKVRTLADYLPLFASDPLLFEPGSASRYSNGGYVLLGLIVEKASGLDYFEYVERNICVPAGMTETGHLQADVPTAGVASGYTRHAATDGSLRNNVYTRPARGSSAGGGYSTAADLFRFACALRQGRLLSAGASRAIYGPAGYAGGAPGINAVLEFEPIPGAVLVVLANGDPPMAMDMSRTLRGLLRRLR